MHDLLAHVRDQLARYIAAFPAESGDHAHLRRQLVDDAALGLRSHMAGHVTSGALVLNPAQDAVLLVDHRFLRRWLAPGGHYEPPGSLLESALREVHEETGVAAGPHAWTRAHDIALDIDTHAIPARPDKGEGPHVHHDFMFLAQALSEDIPSPQEDEVRAACWMPLAGFGASDSARVRRVRAKLAALGLLAA